MHGLMIAIKSRTNSVVYIVKRSTKKMVSKYTVLTLIHPDVTHTKDSSVPSSDSYILSYLVTGI